MSFWRESAVICQGGHWCAAPTIPPSGLGTRSLSCWWVTDKFLSRHCLSERVLPWSRPQPFPWGNFHPGIGRWGPVVACPLPLPQVGTTLQGSSCSIQSTAGTMLRPVWAAQPLCSLFPILLSFLLHHRCTSLTTFQWPSPMYSASLGLLPREPNLCVAGTKTKCTLLAWQSLRV